MGPAGPDPGGPAGPGTERRLVRREDRAGSAVLVLDSPANRNALSRELVGGLLSELAAAAGDPAVRAVALTAVGTTFCSGADLKDPPVQQGPGSYADVLRMLWDYPKPVVVGVNGHVRAGGLGLVAAADVVVSVESATFAFTEVRLGLAPAMIAVVCLRRMTPAGASRYFLTGEEFGAAEAVSVGLVGEVVPSAAVSASASASASAEAGGTSDRPLDRALDRLLDGFRRCEPEALRVTRDLMRRLPHMDVEGGMEYAQAVSAKMFGSETAAEGIAAFREKRPPRWAE